MDANHTPVTGAEVSGVVMGLTFDGERGLMVNCVLDSPILDKAYDEGRADERAQWVPLANLLHACIALAEQNQGTVTLTMAQVLSLSCALKGAIGN